MSNLGFPPIRLQHMAYVTRDLERGQERLTAMFGTGEFTRYPQIGITVPGGGAAQIIYAMAEVNGVPLEVIQPLGGEDEVYRAALPDDPADIAFHHIASRIESEEEWNAILDVVDRDGIEVIVRGQVPGMHYIYLDTRPQVGHILEFIWVESAAAAAAA